jgi:hypothetical protein
LEKARNAAPAVWFLDFYLAAAYALNGCSESARNHLAAAKELQGVNFDRSVTRLGGRFAPAPEIRARFEAMIRAALNVDISGKE